MRHLCLTNYLDTFAGAVTFLSSIFLTIIDNCLFNPLTVEKVSHRCLIIPPGATPASNRYVNLRQ